MTPVALLAIAGMAVMVAPPGAVLLTGQFLRQKRLKARLRAAGQWDGPGTQTVQTPSGRNLLRIVAGLGSAIARSGLLSKRTLDELERTLQAGGMRNRNGLGLFVGSKIVLAAALPLLAFVLLRDVAIKPFLHIATIAAAVVIGLLGPDMVIRRKRQSHIKAVERGLADGLDMMVICAEAGLALEAAINKVGLEIVHAHPRLAEELTITANELHMLSDSRVALTNMGTRTGIGSFKRLGATLVQTIQYGTPLSVALRTLATELRQETLTRYEERAARLPVLLTVPMILFILPCVFLVVAGPIAVQVFATMKH